MPAQPMKTPAPAAEPGIRANSIERYQALLERKGTGQASEADVVELDELAAALKAAPAPPEFHQAMMALARDRQALRESMERIERFLEHLR